MTTFTGTELNTKQVPEGKPQAIFMKDRENKSSSRQPRLNGDRIFEYISFVAALLVLFILAMLFVDLFINSWLSIRKFGPAFLISDAWNPVSGDFGALSSIFGTVVSTLIAMSVAVPLSFFLAFFLVELAPASIARPTSYAIELLAAIPSIIYGMWGLFVLAPVMSEHVQPALADYLGFLPLFSGPPMGIGMLTAGLVLAIMILPFMTAVTRDVLAMIPSNLKEAAFGMGATTIEVTAGISLRYGMSSIIGGLFLGLGRAMGETMAVTFVIGNSHEIRASLLMPANTIASTLANEFAEASEPLYLSSLVELSLILFGLTFIVNTAARFFIKRYKSNGESK